MGGSATGRPPLGRGRGAYFFSPPARRAAKAARRASKAALSLGRPAAFLLAMTRSRGRISDREAIKVEVDGLRVLSVERLQPIAADNNIEVVESRTGNHGGSGSPNERAARRNSGLGNARIREALEPKVEILRGGVRPLKDRGPKTYDQKRHAGFREIAKERPLGVSQWKVA